MASNLTKLDSKVVYELLIDYVSIYMDNQESQVEIQELMQDIQD